jgi:hypothetical protein
MRLRSEALKARHKVARGKRAAKRSAPPLDQTGPTRYLEVVLTS